MPKSEIKETIGCKKKIRVEVESERFDNELALTMKKLKNKVQLPGFRKGKAPEALLLRRFGKAIREEAINDLIPKVLQEVFEEQGINPVSEPEISGLKYDEGTPVVFTVSIEEIPTIDISGFEGMKITKEVTEVTEEDVENYLEQLRRMRAVRTEVDRATQEGDILVVNLQKLDSSGVPLVGDKMEGHVLALDGRSTPSPEFDKQVLGMKKGDAKTVRFTYDESIGNSDLVGKTEAYDVEIVQVIENKIPELDDEFVTSLGQYKDINDLREKTSELLAMQSGHMAERKLRNDMINEFVKSNPFVVPDTMVERVLQSEIENSRKNNPDQPLDEEVIRTQIRPDAVRAVQTYLILDAVKKERGIDVTKEEITERINEIAASTGKDAKELRRSFIKDGRFESLKDEIAQKKAYDWIIEAGNVKEKTVQHKPHESNIIT